MASCSITVLGRFSGAEYCTGCAGGHWYGVMWPRVRGLPCIVVDVLPHQPSADTLSCACPTLPAGGQPHTSLLFFCEQRLAWSSLQGASQSALHAGVRSLHDPTCHIHAFACHAKTPACGILPGAGRGSSLPNGQWGCCSCPFPVLPGPSGRASREAQHGVGCRQLCTMRDK